MIWGGTLQANGLGARLRQIVQTYQHPSRPPQDHVGLMIPYALDPGRALTFAALSEQRAFADVEVMRSPMASVPEYQAPTDLASAEAIALSALGYSQLRIALANQCAARVILGGPLNRFLGLYPGIAEEALETVREGRPLFIVGGFGGAARAVYEAIVGRGNGGHLLEEKSSSVGAGSTVATRAEHHQLLEILKRTGSALQGTDPTLNLDRLAFRPAAMVKTFAEMGCKGLSKNNGLDERENDVLAESQNIHEILGLVVKGLAMITKRSKPAR